jgi:hypothetical protein
VSQKTSIILGVEEQHLQGPADPECRAIRLFCLHMSPSRQATIGQPSERSRGLGALQASLQLKRIEDARLRESCKNPQLHPPQISRGPCRIVNGHENKGKRPAERRTRRDMELEKKEMCVFGVIRMSVQPQHQGLGIAMEDSHIVLWSC